jgi:hypothetical protein
VRRVHFELDHYRVPVVKQREAQAKPPHHLTADDREMVLEPLAGPGTMYGGCMFHRAGGRQVGVVVRFDGGAERQ